MKLQPNFRVQGFDEHAGDAMIYDLRLGYVVDGFNHLWRLSYRPREKALERRGRTLAATRRAAPDLKGAPPGLQTDLE